MSRGLALLFGLCVLIYMQLTAERKALKRGGFFFEKWK
jgi:hypothetical protein